MYRDRKFIALLISLFVYAIAIPANAQSVEVALTGGGYFPLNSQINAQNAWTIGGNVAGRIGGVPFISLYVEVPVFGTFDSTAKIASSSVTNPKYSALFITPGLKVKLGAAFPVSPYFAVGGGLARFSKSNVSTGDTTNTGVFDVAGGIDFKIAPFISARAEVRDFYSGNPKITENFTDRQHQVVATAGLVLRF